jgi:hypothetical protein
MESNRKLCWLFAFLILLPGVLFGRTTSIHKTSLETGRGITIGISVDPADGTYTIFDPVFKKLVLHSRVAAETDHHWLRSSDYPQHSLSRDTGSDELGPRTKLTISNTGLHGQPDLIYSLELHSNPDLVTLAVTVRNSGSNPITV